MVRKHGRQTRPLEHGSFHTFTLTMCMSKLKQVIQQNFFEDLIEFTRILAKHFLKFTMAASLLNTMKEDGGLKVT